MCVNGRSELGLAPSYMMHPSVSTPDTLDQKGILALGVFIYDPMEY